MGHMIEVHRRSEAIERQFKELKTAKVAPRARNLLAHFEQWMNTKGFLTPKQYEALQEIYKEASCGKK